MENTLQSFSPDNLFTEMRSWNKLEDNISTAVRGASADDRVFQKMKLAEYSRLGQKYSGKVLTRDEKAFLLVIKYHQRKMEKALYPGIITRLVRRGYLMIKNRIIITRDEARLKNTPAPYSFETISVPDKPKNEESWSRETSLGQNKRYGQDLGRRMRNSRDHKKGQSL